MNILEVISLGKQVGKVLNKVLDQLPTHDQRIMKEFYKFNDRYQEEIARLDADHDDLILWKERKDELLNTIMKTLQEGNK